MRIRIAGCCLLAILALSAVASASASAHEFKVEGAPLVGEEKVEGSGGVAKLEGEILGTKITIECKKNVFSGTVKAGGTSTASVKFTECTVNVANCKVKEPIEFNVSDLLVGEPVEDEFKPTLPEETFVEITLEGALCALKSTNKVKGTQTCKLPEAGVEMVEHTIECLPTGSKLTFGGNPAKYTGSDKVKLTTAKKWSAI